MSIPVATIGQAITLLIQLSRAYREMTGIVGKAKEEGRLLLPEELEEIDRRYNLSFDKLDEAIEEAKRRRIL